MIRLEGTARRRMPILVLLASGLLAIGMVSLGMLSAGCDGAARSGKTGSHRHQQYHCPMHPTYVADRPGDCPICGMKLVPIESDGGAQASAAAPSGPAGAAAGLPGPRRLLYYRNPMNPSVTSPVPVKDEMGMDYVPVYSDEVPAGSSVEGHASVEVSSEESRLAGLRTTVARRGALARTIRTVGEVKADETRVSQVHTKISGWVEKLFVNSSGQAVRRGQPLLSIYSPELLATQEEFLRARESADRFAASDVPEVRRGGADLFEAAKRRLKLFDVPDSFIDALEKTRQPQRAVTLEAPASGFVTTKDVFAGARIEPGVTLFTVTDLSRVWIEAEVYEYEAPLVRLGQKARVTLAYDPARVYEGRISYVYPYLNTDSRTLRVRFELDNPGLALKPGMYADVELDVQAAEGVLIPDAAILDTGPRQIVYVMTGEGRYEPRQVTVGVRSDGQAQILSGVKAGEAVVDRANFLLDSESRLRAAITSAPGADTAGGGAR
jgi:Cu(I)/Ag(I) efflux system membrane fusion protein